jgi:hypothetical protein
MWRASEVVDGLHAGDAVDDVSIDQEEVVNRMVARGGGRGDNAGAGVSFDACAAKHGGGYVPVGGDDPWPAELLSDIDDGGDDLQVRLR